VKNRPSIGMRITKPETAAIGCLMVDNGFDALATVNGFSNEITLLKFWCADSDFKNTFLS